MTTTRVKQLKNKIMEILKYIQAKQKNRRLEIILYNNEGEKFFRVYTKRLVDFKKRIITETDNSYSPETFYGLGESFRLILDSNEINNKILLREISKFNMWKAKTDIER